MIMQTESDQEGARKLLEIFEGAVRNVILETTDETGIFGQMYGPESVMDSLLTVATTEENVGVPSLPPAVAVYSMEYEKMPFLDLKSSSESSSLKKWHQVPVQISNSSRAHVRIRWIDHNYGRRSSHTWNLHFRALSSDTESSSSWVQHCSPGHLFLLSIVKNAGNEINEQEEDLFSAYDHDYVSPPQSQEVLLAAFRPLRPLPSGNYFSIVIRHDATPSPPSAQQSGLHPQPIFIVETVIYNPYDALVVAAAALDPCTKGAGAAITTKLLKSVLTNLNKHPEEEKYRTLRQSNPKIQKHILCSWGAMQFLTICGFEQKSVKSAENETDEYLIIPPATLEEEAISLQETQSEALKLLEVLSTRAVPGFVLDLAPPTPWEPSRPVTGSGGGKNRRWAENQERRMGFVTAEERWARAERVNQNRRNGRARRPHPGQAPSSRGNWGR